MRNRIPVLGSRKSKASMPVIDDWLSSRREELGKTEGLSVLP